MPEPISIATGAVGLMLTSAVCRRSSAFSDVAEEVMQKRVAIVRYVADAFSLSGATNFLLDKLTDAVRNCGVDDWDGEGAFAVSNAVVANAENFIRALPPKLQPPEISVHPDGTISLDWLPAQHRMFSLSVGESNRIAFAWLDGADSGQAVATFEGASIPPVIVEGVERIINYAEPGIVGVA